jgi:hypothetical protein
MTDRKAPRAGVVVVYPRERLAKRRRVSAPPLKRVHIGAELRAYLMAMGSRS